MRRAIRRSAINPFRFRFFRRQTTASGDTEAAILLALEALPKSGSGPARPYLFEAEAALFNALLVHRQTAVFKHDAGVTQAAFNRTAIASSRRPTIRPHAFGTSRMVDRLQS